MKSRNNQSGHYLSTAVRANQAGFFISAIHDEYFILGVDMNEFLEEKCREYIVARQFTDKNKADNKKKKVIGQVCSSLPKVGQLEKISWFEEALIDESKKWFVLDVFRNTPKLPQNLLIPFIHAAMKEKDVSLHGYFLEPCVKSFGEERVATFLRGYVAEGIDQEKDAAKHLLFWVPKFKNIDAKSPR